MIIIVNYTNLDDNNIWNFLSDKEIRRKYMIENTCSKQIIN